MLDYDYELRARWIGCEERFVALRTAVCAGRADFRVKKEGAAGLGSPPPCESGVRLELKPRLLAQVATVETI